MNFSIIIPAHNEEGSIGKTIRAIEDKVKFNYEVLVVDDHSTDGTVSTVSGLPYNNIRLVENKGEPGFVNTLKCGFDNAKSEIVIPVMADLCDDPDTINKMYDKALQGFDIVCGSRYMRGGRKIGRPRIKGFFSTFVGISLHFLTGIPTHDISNSFKLYKRGIMENIRIDSKGFEISAEIPLKAYFSGHRITEVPTVWVDRKEGESKFKVFQQGPLYLRLCLWSIGKSICRCFR